LTARSGGWADPGKNESEEPVEEKLHKNEADAKNEWKLGRSHEIKMKQLQQSLQDEITKWSTHVWTPCVKSNKVEPNPYCEDEFMITFEVRLNVNLGSQVFPLDVKKRFFTFAQNNVNANPEGDVYQLRIFLQRLDSEFQERLDSIT